MNTPVFVSYCTPHTEEQRLFLEDFEKFLMSEGLRPIMVGFNVHSSGAPLAFIKQRMAECHGTILLAHERVFIERGWDKRHGSARQKLKEEKIATPWHQIEGAFAYAYGHPMLVLLENGIRYGGLLDEHFDWTLYRFDMNKDMFNQPKFKAAFQDWKERVAEAVRNGKLTKSTEADIEKLKLSQFLGLLTWKQWLAYLAVALGLLFSAAKGGYWVAQEFQKEKGQEESPK
jgi:hypothetical protein